jgi:hypothetical protein
MAGVPLVDFSSLGDLYNTYQQSKQGAVKQQQEEQQRLTLAELGQQFMSGNVDYKKAGGQLIRGGQLDQGLMLIKLGDELEADKGFTTTLRNLGQPGASPPPSPGSSGSSPVLPSGTVAPPSSAPRQPIPSTDRVMGDDEGVRLGYYDAPSAQQHGPEFGAAAGMPRLRPASFPQAAPGAPMAPVGQSQQAEPQGPPVSTIAERTAPLGVSPSAGPAPRGAGTENPVSGQIVELAIASGSRRISPGNREIAKAMLTKALDDAKLSDDQKEYWRTYIPQEAAAGRQPKSFEDYKINLKRAGAITSGETKFEQDMAGINAKRWGKYLDQAELAQTKLVDINQMREISQRIAAGGNSPGAWAGLKDVLGPYAEAAGINLKDLSDIQAYTAIIQRLAPQNRAVGSGSTSDIEFKGMLKSMPALIQNPAAREVTLNTMEALARYDMAQGEIAARLASKEITQVQAEKELRALPDPMANFRQWRQQNAKLYSQALSAKPEAQQPTASALPQEFQGKSPTEIMQAAPDKTIFNIQGKKYIKENGKVRPHDG